MMKLISRLSRSKQKLITSGIGVFVLILFSSFVMYEATKAEVVFAENGEEQTINTHKDTVGELLTELGVDVGKHDLLSHQLDALIQSGMTIDYVAAKDITIAIDGKEKDYSTTAETIAAFFEENNLMFTEDDQLSHKTSSKIEDGLHIDVITAFEVEIQNGNDNTTVMTTGGTVKEIIEKAGVSYDQDSKDKITPGLDEEVEKGDKIEVVRVTEEEKVVEETIDYETQTKEDSSLPKGEEKVITEGENGQVTKTYMVTMENGDEVDRELIDEVVKDSVAKVIAVGTKEPKAQQASSNHTNQSSKNASSGSNGKTLTMKASAFTASCSGCSGVTATGINLSSNPNMKIIAVDPNVIPLGTKVHVEGYGEAVAGDTGGNIIGNRIDVHVPSSSDAYAWGVRTVKVTILD
ncbi:G5 and 3D domain-containing protein [Oceanobacillus kimchii]|uniref:G5 and 3D domain-containing protein n=1 Tax=Oceanobacillus kimchii TaxID=746691 RepID=UPI000984E8B4|nr:G5 and 3D domain-containing protein [Oceanobacillus kimchii]